MCCQDIALQVGKTYSGPREALRLSGKFVLAHLLEAAKAGPDLSSSPFVLGLHQEVTTCVHFDRQQVGCPMSKHCNATVLLQVWSSWEVSYFC